MEVPLNLFVLVLVVLVLEYEQTERSNVGVAECWDVEVLICLPGSDSRPPVTIRKRRFKPNPEANLPEDHSRERGRRRVRGRLASARIHIGQKIVNGRLRRRLGFLNGLFNLVVDFFVDTFEIIQIRVTAD
jgi:hypothetical protein